METNEPSRKLAVILHADVAGSTSLVHKNETLTHERVRDAFSRLSEITEKQQGTVQETRGDALVAEFSLASDAVEAALEFQESNYEILKQLKDEIRPEVRIGIAMGEVVIADNTVTGAAVILAQRLEQLAPSGGVCIQATARETIPKRMFFKFDALDRLSLKGFDEPMKAYLVERVIGEGLSETSHVITRKSNKLDLPLKPSIAVLPFINTSGDPEQEYFCDGTTEDIITLLTQFSGLFVIARNSSFAYKGQRTETRAVARELGVRYTLEGSVRKAGTRLRVTSQLVDSTSGTEIWAEHFDGIVDDVFDFQDQIAQNIVACIAPQIELKELDRGRDLELTDLNSYELSLKAQALMNDAIRAGDYQGVLNSAKAAQAVLNQDDGNVRALWTTALSHFAIFLNRWGEDPDKALDSSLMFAGRLVHIAPYDPNGFVVRAIGNAWAGDIDAALVDFHRALDLNPNHSLSLLFGAWGEAMAGLTTEAKDHANHALRLSPKDLDMWLGIGYLALTLAEFADGNFEQAKKWGKLAVLMQPTAPIRRVLLIAACIHTNEPRGVETHLKSLTTFSPNFIQDVLEGRLKIYKQQEHNNLVLNALKASKILEQIPSGTTS